MPNYTERTILSKPRDFADVANNAGSGGVVNNNVTETINNVTVNGSAVSIFNQEFIAAATSTLTWTQNNGNLPLTNLNASIHVYQNGQKLIDSQYSITAPATITIDASTHFENSNYIVFAINII